MIFPSGVSDLICRIHNVVYIVRSGVEVCPLCASGASTDVRHWCEAITRGLHVEEIQRDRKPYLLRYFLAGWNPVTKRPGPSAFLHHFVASDPSDTVHSHPWGWSQSLILVGGYREHRCEADGTHTVHDYGPGDTNVLRATDTHRIELLEADCWTLFLTGSVEQSWNFSPTC